MLMLQGKESRCSIKDDDVPWILDKILVEDAGLIVAGPLYHLRPNSLFESIHERMLPTMFNHPEIEHEIRIGGIISVGGGEPEWTPLGLTLFNIFMLRTRKVVDQMQINFCARPGTVTMHDEYINRARQLGTNIANAMRMPIEQVKYMGQQSDVACPVCHCNIVQILGDASAVYCPVCWVKGTVNINSGKIKVDWDKESMENPRFSEKAMEMHLELVKGLKDQWFGHDMPIAKERMKKYANWGKVIKP
jgi:hypothetical protein